MSHAAVPHAADDHAAGPGHIVPLKVLTAVFVALVVLTGVTVGVAEINLGALNLYVALAVAGIKATLVVLYFMHLRYDRPFNRLLFLSCLVFVVIFISLVLTDTAAYRPSLITGEGPAMTNVHTPFGR